MNRDYINWLETLPCNRKPQKVNVWMGAGRRYLKRLIWLIARLGRTARFSGITMALSLACGVGSSADKKREVGPSACPPLDAMKAWRLHKTLWSIQSLDRDLSQIASAIWIKH